MLQGTKQFKVSTKSDKDSPAQETMLTIVMDECPEDTAVGLAVQHLVVRRQGSWRTNGIPKVETIHMKDYPPGSRNGGMTKEQAIELVMGNPVERAKLLAQLLAAEKQSKK